MGYGPLIFFWVLVMGLSVMAGLVLFPLSLLAATATLIVLYCRQVAMVLLPGTASGLSPVPQEQDRDPAYRHYLTAQVWRDWRSIVRQARPVLSGKAAQALAAAGRILPREKTAWLLLPVWAGVSGGIVASALPVAATALLAAAGSGVAVACGLLVWLPCAGVLRLVEQGHMLVRRILQACPYPRCYARFALPVYACPTCDARHRRLTANLDGALWHVCRCGTRLPTSVVLGRHRLHAYCPDCDRRLPGRIGRVRVEPMPLVGGPDAGKTTFLAMAVDALHSAVDAAGGRVRLADEGDERAYRQLRRELATGRVTKTPPDLPRAVILDVTLKRNDRIIYLFDPSGEHYTGASKVEELRYLAHGEALIMVIDPFALPDIQERLLDDERRALTAKGVSLSPEHPSDTFNRLHNELSGRADGGGQRRVAVVLSKADLLRQTSLGAGVDDDLAGWLTAMGLGNIVRELANRGVEARYHLSGFPPEPGQISRLIGWLTGLPLNDAASRPPELTTGGPHAAPWTARPRPEGSAPLGYVVVRRSLAAVTFMMSASVMLGLSLLVLSWFGVLG
ncbi:TRAFAC clade GTPase domain-containing protein [Sinosporangium siamense]|nr:hypothetical protein [Sinosporangium siamense]